MGLYNSQGQRKVTIVDGNTYTGIYAPDGSYNGVITNGSTVGLYHPCGAYNVTPTDKYTNPLPVYANDGSLYVTEIADGEYVIHKDGLQNYFSLDDYLYSVGGSYWDFTKTDDQFVEATGPTPANTIGQSIGLKLDRGLWGGKTLAQVIAAATELVTNGTSLVDTTGWTGSNATLSTSGGVLIVTATTNGTAARATQTLSGLIVGSAYRLSLNIRKPNGATPSTGCFISGLGAGGSTAYTTSASFVPTTIYFIATATSHVLNLDLSATGLVAGVTAEFNSISCKLIPGYAATQSSASLKPTVS